MLRTGKPLMLNLGCGARTHEAWVNIDHSLKLTLKRSFFARPSVSRLNPVGYMSHDLRRGIPFPDGAADVVYASHVLEHLARKHALPFMREIHRVLKANGIVRIVVPDLEKAATAYLEALHVLRLDARGTPSNKDRHEWATIMLLDQLVRTQPGGEMAKWLREHRQSKFVQAMKGILSDIAVSSDPCAGRRGVKSRVVELLRLRDPAKTGELHRWMYDDISLSQLFVQAGFKDVKRMSHLRSRIPKWPSYCLDNNLDSSPHQPDSIWMEAIK